MSNHGARDGAHSGAHSGERTGGPGPYWKRAHRDWRFWVGALFMAVALIVYVMSDDLALLPRAQPSRPAPAAVSP